MVVYAALVVVIGIAYARLPAGFVPVDDQGYITADIMTPPDASFPRTLEAVKRVEEYLAKRDAVDTVTVLTGYSYLGQGVNTAQAFITLKDWSERGAKDSAAARTPTAPRRRWRPTRPGHSAPAPRRRHSPVKLPGLPSGVLSGSSSGLVDFPV